MRQLSAADLLEIEKKVQEIERGTRGEDIDEDDAGKSKTTCTFYSKEEFNLILFRRQTSIRIS